MGPLQVTPEALDAMRDWVADCCWSDLDPGEEDTLTDGQLILGVRRHYGGGVAGFLWDMMGAL